MKTKKNDSSIMWKNRKETVADKIIKSISIKKGQLYVAGAKYVSKINEIDIFKNS